LDDVLLDTNALYWLVSGEKTISQGALLAIARAQEFGTLYVSPITAWELALASKKPTNPTHFGQLTATKWFANAVKEVGAKLLPIGVKIAGLASDVAEQTGHKDPGDCFIIAAAKFKSVPLVTSDSKIIQLSKLGYLLAIKC
jgi:PIN domain nuclease of toxin-antitoxin system